MGTPFVANMAMGTQLLYYRDTMSCCNSGQNDQSLLTAAHSVCTLTTVDTKWEHYTLTAINIQKSYIHLLFKQLGSLFSNSYKQMGIPKDHYRRVAAIYSDHCRQVAAIIQ